jgi:mono/diheme cytochrome c family protein
MKSFLILSSFLLILGTAVYSCGGSDKQTKTEAVAADPGAQLFTDNCVVCHGEDGKAGMSGATDLSSSVLSHDNTVAVITNGRNGMRPFGSQFTKEEIEAIAKHVESLRK